METEKWGEIDFIYECLELSFDSLNDDIFIHRKDNPSLYSGLLRNETKVEVIRDLDEYFSSRFYKPDVKEYIDNLKSDYQKIQIDYTNIPYGEDTSLIESFQIRIDSISKETPVFRGFDIVIQGKLNNNFLTEEEVVESIKDVIYKTHSLTSDKLKHFTISFTYLSISGIKFLDIVDFELVCSVINLNNYFNDFSLLE